MRDLPSLAACRILGSLNDLGRRPFPEIVRVETTNACNAHCVICPHREMDRAVQRMEQSPFVRIIDECAAHECREVHLHNFGEPLLDKDLEARVHYAKQQGIRKVKIFTNGSLLDHHRARGLIEAGLDEIKISMDGAAREEFEQIRTPLEYDRVVGNVKELVALRDTMRSPMRIRFTCCSTSDKNETMRSLEGLVDGFSFGKIHNWAGEDCSQRRWQIRKPCSRLWRTFTILAGGEVALCCLDYNGQVILGQLDSRKSIRDLWNSAPYRHVRALHRQARQSELSLCRNCTKAFLYRSEAETVVISTLVPDRSAAPQPEPSHPLGDRRLSPAGTDMHQHTQ